MSQIFPHREPVGDIAAKQRRVRDARLRRLTLTHRCDMIWEILASDLGSGTSILDIAVGMFAAGESDTLDLPLHDLASAAPGARLRQVLVDLRRACIDVGDALPVLPLGGITVATRFRHPSHDANVTARFKGSPGARFEGARFWLSLSKKAAS